ncbi:MAG: hypothetical protein CM1200mP26_18350 [Acidimicrobiales bacterium]|nr:MAG: hypothetical protein CM1200mP26_18350 [Acidimicrobiales bacterium]
MAGMNTKSGVIYDARGLVEPDPEPPMTAEVDGDSAVIDATDLTTRKINLELKRIVYDEGVNTVTIVNPLAPSTPSASASSSVATSRSRAAPAGTPVA